MDLQVSTSTHGRPRRLRAVADVAATYQPGFGKPGWVEYGRTLAFLWCRAVDLIAVQTCLSLCKPLDFRVDGNLRIFWNNNFQPGGSFATRGGGLVTCDV